MRASDLVGDLLTGDGEHDVVLLTGWTARSENGVGDAPLVCRRHRARRVPYDAQPLPCRG
jgi:hypothetical protein